MKKSKWNYAIVKSIFGELWIGRTKLKADEKKVFSKLETAEEIFKRNVTGDKWEEYEFDKEDGEKTEEIIKAVEKFITIID